jgi:hypothetical protein
MAESGLQWVFNSIEHSASDDAVNRHIDQFKTDLKQLAERYGWRPEKVAKQIAKLRVMLVTAAQRQESGAGRFNFQTAIDRLDE